MFPLLRGNLDPTWPANGPAVAAPSLAALLGRAAQAPIAGLWALALLGATCLAVYLLTRPGEHPSRAHWGLRIYAAAIASCVVWIGLLAYVWWGIGPPSAYPRFWAPVAVACVLLPIALMNADDGRRRLRTTASGFVALVLVGTASVAPPQVVGRTLLRAAADTGSGRVGDRLQADRYGARRDQYSRAAALVPPGSRVLAAVDVPSLLLSEGFDVNTIDLVGSTSPPPHLPYFQGTDAKLRWLRAHGYQYVIAVEPSASACLYSSSKKEEDLTGKHGPQYQAWAPYYFDWFQFLDDLSSTPGSARVGTLVVAKVASSPLSGPDGPPPPRGGRAEVSESP
jgi:hypothetical protein